MRHELQSPQVTSLIAAEFLLTDISNIFHYLAQMLRRHISFLRLNEASLALLAESVALCAQPFLLLLGEFGDMRISGRSVAWRWGSHARRRRYGTRAPSWRRRRWREGGLRGSSRDCNENSMNFLLKSPSGRKFLTI